MEKTCLKNSFRIVLPLLLIASFNLVSCWEGNQKINIIMPGYFEGIEQSCGTQKVNLSVAEIDETEYKDANGLNVLQDVVTLKYYMLELYLTDAIGIETKYDLVNLVDYYEGIRPCPAIYTDGHIDITPQVTINLSKRPSQLEDMPYYAIDIHKSDYLEIEFIFDLYKKGE